MKEKYNFFGLTKSELNSKIDDLFNTPRKPIEDSKTIKDLKSIVLKYRKTFFPFDNIPNFDDLGFTEIGNMIRSYRERIFNQEHLILRLKIENKRLILCLNLKRY